jgi:ribosomal-protein-alanine N-acetyltransferase
MLTGDKVVLRPVRERDLEAFIEAHTEISNRGEFFPLGVLSEPVLRRTYAETGLWERDAGTLVIWDRDEVMVGHIEFFRPVAYWDAYELSYQLYGQEHAGQGYTTEAVRLLVDYLFGVKKVNRISLVIVPENAPSRRVADKCGFQLEGTARGAFFHGGRSVDVLIYSLVRDDPRPWRTSD